MSTIITEKFRLHNASQFVESFIELSASTYYLFLGKQLRSHQLQLVVQIVHHQPRIPEDEFRAWNSMLGAKEDFIIRCQKVYRKKKLVKWNCL